MFGFYLSDAWYELLRARGAERACPWSLRMMTAACRRAEWARLDERDRAELLQFEGEIVPEPLPPSRSDPPDDHPPAGPLRRALRFTAVLARALMVEAFGPRRFEPPAPPFGEDYYVNVVDCVLGDVLCPVALGPGCLTEDVIGLARAAHRGPRSPHGWLEAVRLAVLADALEEAGAPEAVVSHLRGPGPHFRGCWPVMLVLCGGRPHSRA